MQIIEPFIEIESDELSRAKLGKIERAARTCYKSEYKGDPDFIRRIVKRGHESVLEHEKVTVRIICDRGVSHEIVRHRLGAYSQESTRYCNYSKGKFGGELTFINPFGLKSGNKAIWTMHMEAAEKGYMVMTAEEPTASPEWARSVLPNSLKTEIVVTYNMREWRHFFRVRCDKAAHPQMRQIAIPLLMIFSKFLPELFDDIPYDKAFDPENFAEVRFV